MSHKQKLISLLFVGLVLRLIFIPHPGFKADIAFWKWWGKEAVEKDIVESTKKTNYPPIYLYILKGTSWAYSVFKPLDGDYWNDNNFLYLLLIKIPYIAADLAIALLIFKILNQESRIKNYEPKPIIHNSLFVIRNIALFAMAMFLLNPAVIYNGAIWGQTDSMSSFFILLALLCLTQNKLLSFGILIPINIFLKVQSAPFMVLGLITLLRKQGTSLTLKTLVPGTITAFFITLPYILKNSFELPLNIMFNSLGYFPYASLNAYNLHWLLIRGSSDRYPDENLILNLVSHKTLGFGLFFLCFAILVVYLWQNTSKDKLYDAKDKITLFLTSLLTIFSSYMFMTEIHERYMFPVYVFGALVIGIEWTIKNGQLTITSKKPPPNFPFSIFHFQFTPYVLLSLSGLLNLHFVMIQNYPDNNPAFLSFLIPSRIPLSVFLSALNLAIFIYLFSPIAKSVMRNLIIRKFDNLRIYTILAILALFLASRFMIRNSSQRISLTSLKPTYTHQEWGELKKNFSVGGNLLAPAYYFHRTGLGTHANSQIDYKLDGKYKTFKTSYGLDIESNDGGSAEFVIALDDKPMFKSETMRKWTPPGFVELPMTGVKKLTLIVLDAGDGKNGDHADWLEPTLYK